MEVGEETLFPLQSEPALRSLPLEIPDPQSQKKDEGTAVKALHLFHVGVTFMWTWNKYAASP